MSKTICGKYRDPWEDLMGPANEHGRHGERPSGNEAKLMWHWRSRLAPQVYSHSKIGGFITDLMTAMKEFNGKNIRITIEEVDQ